MQIRRYRDRSRKTGAIAFGVTLAELGILQFLKLQFGIDWPQMWPLWIAGLGLIFVLSAFTRKERDNR